MLTALPVVLGPAPNFDQRCICTAHPQDTRLVQKNIDSNQAQIRQTGGSVDVWPLDWADANRTKQIAALGGIGTFDIVLGSELLYAAPILGDPPTHAALIGTMLEVLELGRNGNETADAGSATTLQPVALLAQEWHMGFEDLFFEECAEARCGCQKNLSFLPSKSCALFVG
eukprot:SAG31_NODE_4208_length_3473_cov_2.441612_4_plen_171_part_00